MSAPARAAAPDLPSFEEIVAEHQRELMSAALRYTRNRADAEDLVQQVLTDAYRAWGRFDPDLGTARAWLRRVLYNKFVSGYRSRQRQSAFCNHPEAAAALFGERARSRGARVPEELSVLGDDVVLALDALSEEHLEVVVMADLQGLAYREIAAELDLPVGTVMSRLSRARRELEVRLRDYALAEYGIGR